MPHLAHVSLDSIKRLVQEHVLLEKPEFVVHVPYPHLEALYASLKHLEIPYQTSEGGAEWVRETAQELE